MELEGFLQGLGLVLREGWLPAMVEGDSNILIQMKKQLANGRTTEKVSSSWHLASRLETLRGLVMTQPVVSFHHVRRNANKVADMLANIGTGGNVDMRMGRMKDFGEAQWAPRC